MVASTPWIWNDSTFSKRMRGGGELPTMTYRSDPSSQNAVTPAFTLLHSFWLMPTSKWSTSSGSRFFQSSRYGPLAMPPMEFWENTATSRPG